MKKLVNLFIAIGVIGFFIVVLRPYFEQPHQETQAMDSKLWAQEKIN